MIRALDKIKVDNKPQKQKSNIIYILKGTNEKARCLGKEKKVTTLTIMENFYNSIRRQKILE